MEKKVKDILQLLKLNGVDYADIRVVTRKREELITENCKVLSILDSESFGIGIRVIFHGALGFACSQDIMEIEKTAFKALELAKISKIVQNDKIQLCPKETIVDSYYTPIKINPFEIPRKEKLELLLEAEKAMHSSAKLSRTTACMKFQKEDKIFADIDGSYITQIVYQSGGGIAAYASTNTDTQVRSYPDSFGGTYACAGYEYIEGLQLRKNAPIIAKEVESLIGAKQCPSGIFDILIDGSQMAIQIHETIGHAVELDRVLGAEAAFAGMSFMDINKISEKYQYASNCVNVVADATIVNGLGTYGYDDDGVKAQRFSIIENGIFINFLTSRDTSISVGQSSNGCNIADNWYNTPIIRMPNINLLPGEYEMEQLIEGIENGLYLRINKSWSIDDKRVNFQFGCEIAHEIKNGKLTGKIYKNPVYTGITSEFWKKCDGISNSKNWIMYGIPNCIKGQPSQVSRVGHGASPTRFRNIKLGV